MTARSNRFDLPTTPPRPLSNWIITAGALIVLVVAAVVWSLLLRRYGGEGAQIQLDAIRTAGTLVIGTGGAVALLLTARRQRSTELTLMYTNEDATKRRNNELYFKAVEQLGSDQATMRRAGLYALERLAHDTVEDRQIIVSIICDYLSRPDDSSPQPAGSVFKRFHRSPGSARRRGTLTLTDRPPRATHTSDASRRDQVRLTAQEILLRNLRVTKQPRRRWWHRTPPRAILPWPGIRLDLAGALLFDFDLSGCQLDHVDFTGAEFIGRANFENAEFAGEANFGFAKFTGKADFENAEFIGEANFGFAKFIGRADFTSVEFTDRANFENAEFAGEANFGFAKFTGKADFASAQFTDEADFEFSRFASKADFDSAQFTNLASFIGSKFAGGAHFTNVQFTQAVFTVDPSRTSTLEKIFSRQPVSAPTPIYFWDSRIALANAFRSVWPRGWTTRPAKPDNGEDPAFLYLTNEKPDPQIHDPGRGPSEPTSHSG